MWHRRTRIPGVLLVLGALVGCAAPGISPQRSVIEGKVSLGGRGVAEAEVFLLPLPLDLASSPTPVAWSRSADQGEFEVAAPPGRYLVFARAGDRFSFFGRNPVLLRNNLDGLNLPLVPVHPVVRTQTVRGTEGLSGRALFEGRPVTGARITAYLDPSGGLRGPGYARSRPTGADGRFSLPLPPGTYFVAARARSGGRDVGTLSPGDRFGVLPSFPVRLREGEIVQVAIETVVVPSHEQMARFHGGFAMLTGRIVDDNDRPLAGMRACLYPNPQMLDRPTALSEPTGQDGRFTLKTSLAGPYFLGAREQLGGPPAPGERIGFHLSAEGARVDIPAGGRLDGLVVVVRTVP